MDGRDDVPRRDEVVSLIRRAVQAPSSHNTQPWRFRIGGRAVVLLADRTRALPVNDPDDRELAISCGCALLNLLVAAEAEGFAPCVTLIPEDEDDEALARVDLRRAGGAPPRRSDLLPAIAMRHTHRHAFLPRPVLPDLRAYLVEVAAEEGATLEIADNDARRRALAAFVAEGDACQWANPAWRRELAMWMHPRRHDDGIVLPGLLAPVAQAVVRTFDLGGGVAASDRHLADGSPVLAVLSTAGDELRDRLTAGMALQRVLLEAAMRGVQASYLNQPVQVPWIRAQLAGTLRTPAIPQLVLRLGYAGEVRHPAPRRPIEDVVE